MSQLATSEGQPGNWEEPDFFLRMLETVRFQENGWQEPCESRGSRTDLWERGGEIPLRHPTQRFGFLTRVPIGIKIKRPTTFLQVVGLTQ